jgi:hypothetical protein
MFTCIMQYCFHCSICALRRSLFSRGNRKRNSETGRDQRGDVRRHEAVESPSGGGTNSRIMVDLE